MRDTNREGRRIHHMTRKTEEAEEKKKHGGPRREQQQGRVEEGVLLVAVRDVPRDDDARPFVYNERCPPKNYRENLIVN